jgi:hypothetical protein
VLRPLTFSHTRSNLSLSTFTSGTQGPRVDSKFGALIDCDITVPLGPKSTQQFLTIPLAVKILSPETLSIYKAFRA